ENRPCPFCASPVISRRDYYAGPYAMRTYCDCPRCCRLIEDKPAELSVLTSVDARATARVGCPITVRVRISNPFRSRTLAGALHVSLSPQDGHALRPTSPVFRFRIPPQMSRTLALPLKPTGAATLAQLYTIRVVGLA